MKWRWWGWQCRGEGQPPASQLLKLEKHVHRIQPAGSEANECLQGLNILFFGVLSQDWIPRMFIKCIKKSTWSEISATLDDDSFMQWHWVSPEISSGSAWTSVCSKLFFSLLFNQWIHVLLQGRSYQYGITRPTYYVGLVVSVRFGSFLPVLLIYRITTWVNYEDCVVVEIENNILVGRVEDLALNNN